MKTDKPYFTTIICDKEECGKMFTVRSDDKTPICPHCSDNFNKGKIMNTPITDLFRKSHKNYKDYMYIGHTREHDTVWIVYYWFMNIYTKGTTKIKMS